MREKLTGPVKAYKNLAFLNSPSARLIRILSEMIEPESRFRRYRIHNTVVFFGSSRTISEDAARRNLTDIQNEIDESGATSAALASSLEMAKKDLHMSRYYEDAADLAEKLAIWFKQLESRGTRINICTGGGPGIMEAANLGASRAQGRSVGLNISLPFEQRINPFQTEELSFEFHYFFIRKFWFVYLAKALIVFPGGFGTLDELFELLTLIQTEKTKKKMPIVLYGSEYWKEVLNFDALVKWGTISPEDLELFATFDDVDEAFAYIQTELTNHFLKGGGRPARRAG